jgi:hypothetical protein
MSMTSPTLPSLVLFASRLCRMRWGSRRPEVWWVAGLVCALLACGNTGNGESGDSGVNGVDTGSGGDTGGANDLDAGKGGGGLGDASATDARHGGDGDAAGSSGPDGTTGGDQDARAAGDGATATGGDAGCAPPSAFFPCAPGTCNGASEYCLETALGNSCVDIPVACQCTEVHDCSCLLANVSSPCGVGAVKCFPEEDGGLLMVTALSCH